MTELAFKSLPSSSGKARSGCGGSAPCDGPCSAHNPLHPSLIEDVLSEEMARLGAIQLFLRSEKRSTEAAAVGDLISWLTRVNRLYGELEGVLTHTRLYMNHGKVHHPAWLVACTSWLGRVRHKQV